MISASPTSLAQPPGAPPPATALPELLAPAGDWDCARAAVENGADAIYFGLEKFNARMRAHNFTEADLPRVMQFLHKRGVKGYVTFNTLVIENELAEAEQYARCIIAAGVDAAIIQDVGICRLIRRLSPEFPIHVSTQMTVTSAGGIEFARELGCNLVVLARECSLKEIEKIQSATAPRSLPLEVFVHGALCVAYSGQCLTSEALGGRSANRGECAQACRMPYDLVSDGQMVPLGDRKYLLSPQDLAGLAVLPDLVRLGVASLKIEGRLKTSEYVASITSVYRQALEKLRAPLPPSPGQPATPAEPLAASPAEEYQMEMAFSRGLYTGWFGGTNNQALVHGRFGKKRGVYLGQVSEVRREAVLLLLEGPLKPGDGIVFDAGRPEEKEEGGRVYEIRPISPNGRRAAVEPGIPPVSAPAASPGSAPPPLVELRFGHGDIDFARVHAGDKLWKTSDSELERRLRKSFEGDAPRFQRPIDLETHGLAGKPLTLIARDESGHVAQAQSAMPLVPAQKQPLTSARLREQLGRLGGTAYRLGELRNHLSGDVLLPVSELNRLRRDIVARLDDLRAQPLQWTLSPPAASEVDARANVIPPPESLPSTEPATRLGVQSRELGTALPPQPGTTCAVSSNLFSATQARTPVSAAQAQPDLIVLVRNFAQLDAALQSGVQTLYCELEDPKKYREAVARFRDFPHRSLGASIFVAPPRIFKMGEDWTLNQVRSSEADGYLVRNYDHLKYFARQRCIGDYSLNISNHLSADYFKHRFKLERVTASYDLNFTQLEALLRGAPPSWFEVTVHQHMPMFHMEHCIFCAFLSDGTDYTNCGRPCDHHDLKLRDRVGAEHPVKADAGCRNTVFNCLAQTGAEYVSDMLALGLRHFRLEFLTEPPDLVRRTIGEYRKLLQGQISGAHLWRELKLFNQLGVTRGQIAGSKPL